MSSMFSFWVEINLILLTKWPGTPALLLSLFIHDQNELNRTDAAHWSITRWAARIHTAKEHEVSPPDSPLIFPATMYPECVRRGCPPVAYSHLPGWIRSASSEESSSIEKNATYQPPNLDSQVQARFFRGRAQSGPVLPVLYIRGGSTRPAKASAPSHVQGCGT
jgi:hypothetical protein